MSAAPGVRANPPHVAGPDAADQVPGWQLDGLLAESQLCRLYRARPADSPSDCSPAYALKVLRPERGEDPSSVRAIRREALVGRTIAHRHLVPVLAASVDKPPRFLVMPYLAGRTLAELSSAGCRIDLPMVLWITRQTAEALGALVDAGWMHGDIKPGNLHVAATGHTTVLDLGFARRPDAPGSDDDRCVLGTCHYIAPEIITSALRSDIRSDIYSLGAVLFEMLSGRPPFPGDDASHVAEQHRQAAPPDLHQLRPHLPEEVVELVRAMLAKEPLRRPQTPAELIERLATLEIRTFADRSWL